MYFKACLGSDVMIIPCSLKTGLTVFQSLFELSCHVLFRVLQVVLIYRRRLIISPVRCVTRRRLVITSEQSPVKDVR